MLRAFLDRNIQERRSQGLECPAPCRIRLTGDLNQDRIYDNLDDLLAATAHVDRMTNVEIEVTAGVFESADFLWALLALRRYEQAR